MAALSTKNRQNVTDVALHGACAMTEPAISPRVARSRERILRAATELLVEFGPRAVTVDAVSEASGVAKSTLYRHWPSRNDLLVDVVRSNIPDIEPPDLGAGFASALRQLVGSAADAFGDPNWSRIFAAITSLRLSMPELESFLQSDTAAKKVTLTEILDLGVAEGVLPGPLDVDDAANMLVGPLVFAAVAGGDEARSPERLSRLADHVVERFIESYRS